MQSLKKLLTIALLLVSPSLLASQYMIVQCNMNPATELAAKFSDPNTGKMITVESCGVALAQVPKGFSLISGNSAGASSAGFVNYLFGPAMQPKNS